MPNNAFNNFTNKIVAFAKKLENIQTHLILVRNKCVCSTLRMTQLYVVMPQWLVDFMMAVLAAIIVHIIIEWVPYSEHEKVPIY